MIKHRSDMDLMSWIVERADMRLVTYLTFDFGYVRTSL
jgi:hypothetical protein